MPGISVSNACPNLTVRSLVGCTALPSLSNSVISTALISVGVRLSSRNTAIMASDISSLSTVFTSIVVPSGRIPSFASTVTSTSSVSASKVCAGISGSVSSSSTFSDFVVRFSSASATTVPSCCTSSASSFVSSSEAVSSAGSVSAESSFSSASSTGVSCCVSLIPPLRLHFAGWLCIRGFAGFTAGIFCVFRHSFLSVFCRFGLASFWLGLCI